MKSRGRHRGLAGAVGVALLVGIVLRTRPALALQPLATFIDNATGHNPDAQVADATLRQRAAQADVQLSRLLPSFNARGVLTHNQYPAIATLPNIGTLTIIPENQLDAFLSLDVPLVDLAQFARYDAQKIQVELAEANRGLTRRQLEERVVRSYYTLAATAALGRSADKNLDVAQKNLDVVKTRLAAGVAADLDLARAIANVEGARQDVADAELSRVLAHRSLETLSRVAPEPATTFAEDGLVEEAAVGQWLRRGHENLPELRVVEAQVRLEEANARAAQRAYLPTLSAQAQERFTNATGFTGRTASYTLSATLSYRFDLATIAQNKVEQASADVTRARAEGTRRGTEDAIVEAWQRVTTNLAKARAARAQVRATATAARLTQDRYATGVSTQLDVTQAQRDAFGADVARIQADLALAQSRAVLRLASGEPLTSAPKDTTTPPTAPAREHP